MQHEGLAVLAGIGVAHNQPIVMLVLLLGARIQKAVCQAAAAAPASSPPSQQAEQPTANQTAQPPSRSTCELQVLQLLGWQQAYNASGYAIVAEWPSNCSASTWQALECLQSHVNLTLTGSLPNLPDSWADNGSFPALQIMNFTGPDGNIAGSLPSSWAAPTAFSELQVLNLSTTQLSGTLPPEWGQPGALAALSELHLAGANLTGHTHPAPPVSVMYLDVITFVLQWLCLCLCVTEASCLLLHPAAHCLRFICYHYGEIGCKMQPWI